MSLVKDTLIIACYFFLLSTVLQTEDAFVFYQDSQNPPDTTVKSTKLRQLFIFVIFALLYYVTLVVAPFLNVKIKSLALATCAMLLLKYICELATFMHILTNIFELSAIFLDVAGQALFYLSTVRLIQIICQTNSSIQKSGRCMAVFTALYAFSITIGYALAYWSFRKTPVWLFLIIQTSLTIVASFIAYFTFRFQPQSITNNQLNQEQSNARPSVPEVQPQPEAEPQAFHMQIYRPGIQFSNILKMTLFLYNKMFLLVGVQTTLGILLGFYPILLQFLVWTTQTESVSECLHHNMQVMVIFGIGATLSSIIIGWLCDSISIRKMGYLVLTFSVLIFSFLYLAISIKYFYTTFLLYMFLGMATFALFTWLLCACSKLFGGIFQVFSVNSQWIGLAFSGYMIFAILFNGKIAMQTRLCMQLALLIIQCIISFFFVKKLPLTQVIIVFENSNQTRQQQQQIVIQDQKSKQKQYDITQKTNPREYIVEQIEMSNRNAYVEEELNKQSQINRAGLL